MKEPVSFTLNGKAVEVNVDPGRSLMWVLRTDLRLTGTKYGCGESYCGACTVLVDDEAVRSCQATVADVRGRRVVTIEGLADGGALHPLQRAFAENDAMQCGYCTPGMILGAYALLKKNPRPSDAQIVSGMEDHLCRCGAHKRIVEAIHAAAGEMGGR